MFSGVILDIWTTWVIAMRDYGMEKNPTLTPLIKHSLIWIPIYLSCRPVLVPFIPGICRFGFSIYFGFMGLFFGLNNLGGILYGNFFLVDMFGFPALQGTCIFFAITAFIWMVRSRANNAQERNRHIITALIWIGIFVVLELGFLAIGRITSY